MTDYMKFDLKCEVCGQTPAGGTTLFRTGGKGHGINPHWRCEPHLHATIPGDVREIVGQIESDRSTKQ